MPNYSCHKHYLQWFHANNLTKASCEIAALSLKGTGGSGVKNHVDLIWKILSLWCQHYLQNVKNFLHSEVIGVSMSWPFDFSIVILGVIFDTFYTSFGYKNWNIETNTLTFCIKVHFNKLFWMKNFDFEIFVNFGWFRQI